MASSEKGMKDFLCLLAVSLLVILGVSDAAFTENIDRCPPHTLRDKSILRTVGSRCYQFIRTEKRWQQARSDCRNRGGDLITIQTREIQHMVQDAMSRLWRKNGMWIGASDIYREMEWLWVTGERVGYNNWDGGQPSCRLFKFMCHEDCGVVRKDKGYRWHDYLCGSDLFNYGYACQYDLLAPPPTTKPTTTSTTSSTTSSTTTTSTTTKATTTPAKASTVTMTTRKTTMKLPNANTTIVFGSSELTSRSTTSAPIQVTNSSISVHVVPENIVNVNSQRLSKKESGLKTGGVVGLVITFLIVFLAGLIFGIVMCRRRNRHKYPEDFAIGFNNVLYTAAPRRPSLDGVKETNVLAAAAACNVDDDDDDDDDDNGYSSIDEVQACAKNVNLPTAKEIQDCEAREQLRENHYETVPSEPLEEEGGDMDEIPPPYPGCSISAFRPEFLKKDTDVSQAYSNNLYGYKK